MVDVDESEGFVYALASVPGYASRDVLIGLEPGWLAILAQRVEYYPRAGTGGIASARETAAFEEELCGQGESAPVQTFCVMSLPSEVNPLDSIAVLAKGVLGIRMRKAPGRIERRR